MAKGTPNVRPWELHFELGVEHGENFRIRQAKQSFDKSLQLSVAARDREGITWSNYELGKLYSKAQYYGLAQECFAQALTIFEELQQHRNAAYCLRELAELDLIAGGAELALDYLMRGKRLLEQYGEPQEAEQFDSLIFQLTHGIKVHLFVSDPEEYRRELGPVAE